jgi:hypothetical protein
MDIGAVGGKNPLQQAALEAMRQAASPDAAGAVGSPGSLDKADMAAFQDAMRPDGGSQTPGADRAAQTGGVAPAQPTSVGDRILQGRGALSDSVKADRTAALDAMSGKSVNQADLLKAQFAMMESSNLVSAVSKSTEKLTSAIKTLQQG